MPLLTLDLYHVKVKDKKEHIRNMRVTDHIIDPGRKKSRKPIKCDYG